MYDRDGSNEAQLLRTYDIAKDRLAQMEAQRAELDVAILTTGAPSATVPSIMRLKQAGVRVGAG